MKVKKLAFDFWERERTRIPKGGKLIEEKGWERKCEERESGLMTMGNLIWIFFGKGKEEPLFQSLGL